MSEKISSKDVFSWCKKYSVSLTDDVKKKIENTKELNTEDLKTISGGCGESPIPENPPCKKCGSTDTWTEYNYPVYYRVHCRTCKKDYTCFIGVD